MVHVQPMLVAAAKKYPNGSKNFFALYRVDIILDKDLKPHVIEVWAFQSLACLSQQAFEIHLGRPISHALFCHLQVNQSPNLSSAHFKDLATMFRKISNAFIRLVSCSYA